MWVEFTYYDSRSQSGETDPFLEGHHQPTAIKGYGKHRDTGKSFKPPTRRPLPPDPVMMSMDQGRVGKTSFRPALTGPRSLQNSDAEQHQINNHQHQHQHPVMVQPDEELQKTDFRPQPRRPLPFLPPREIPYPYDRSRKSLPQNHTPPYDTPLHIPELSHPANRSNVGGFDDMPPSYPNRRSLVGPPGPSEGNISIPQPRYRDGYRNASHYHERNEFLPSGSASEMDSGNYNMSLLRLQGSVSPIPCRASGSYVPFAPGSQYQPVSAKPPTPASDSNGATGWEVARLDARKAQPPTPPNHRELAYPINQQQLVPFNPGPNVPVALKPGGNNRHTAPFPNESGQSYPPNFSNRSSPPVPHHNNNFALGPQNRKTMYQSGERLTMPRLPHSSTPLISDTYERPRDGLYARNMQTPANNRLRSPTRANGPLTSRSTSPLIPGADRDYQNRMHVSRQLDMHDLKVQNRRDHEETVVNPSEPIIGYDGRAIDPIDYLPETTWAPEPEKFGDFSAEKRMQTTRGRRKITPSRIPVPVKTSPSSSSSNGGTPRKKPTATRVNTARTTKPQVTVTAPTPKYSTALPQQWRSGNGNASNRNWNSPPRSNQVQMRSSTASPVRPRPAAAASAVSPARPRPTIPLMKSNPNFYDTPSGPPLPKSVPIHVGGNKGAGLMGSEDDSLNDEMRRIILPPRIVGGGPGRQLYGPMHSVI